jgi:hypothetical protein
LLYIPQVENPELQEKAILVINMLRNKMPDFTDPSQVPIITSSKKVCIYIYINKDGNPSTKSTKHVDANVDTLKENQNNQNSSNDLENLMLKSFPKNLPMSAYKAFDFTNTKLVFPSLGYLPGDRLCPIKKPNPRFP